MIRHILRKDLKLLWPLVTAVTALQVTTFVLLGTAGPLQRWDSGRGSAFGWMSNGLLPFVCLVGLVVLVLAVVHQDRFPGTSQDWLVRPIARRTLVLAKLAFIGVAGLLPVFVCDVATGLVEHLPPGAVIEASAARCLLLFALIVLPAGLVGVVTRSLADALVLCVIVLVLLVVEFMVAQQLKLQTPLVEASYGWVVTAALVCANAIVVPILVALQFVWRSTNRLRWIAAAVLAFLPLVLLLPGRSALVAQQLVGRGAESFRPTLALDPKRPSLLTWPSEKRKRTQGSGAEPMIEIPLNVAIASPTAAWRIDYQTFRVITPAGKILYVTEQARFGRYESYLTDRLKDAQALAFLPVAVATDALARHAIVEVTLGVTVFERGFQGSLASLDGRSLDATSRCRRVVNDDFAGTQCISTHPISPCTYASGNERPDYLRAGNCGQYAYAPWPISFWRDAYYTAELSDPSHAAEWEGARERGKAEDSVVNFVPRAHDVVRFKVRLEEFKQSVEFEHGVSRDGNGSEARFATPSALVSDREGTLYLADRADSVLRRIAPSGEVTTLAGAAGQCGRADGRGAEARFCHPNGLAIDPAGNLYVVDAGNALVRKVSPGGDVTTTAMLYDPKAYPTDWLERAHLLTRTPDGSLYVVIASKRSEEGVIRIAPDGRVSTVAGASSH